MKRVLGIVIAMVLTAALAWPVQAATQVVLPIDGYYERQTIKGFGTLADDAFHEQHRDLFPFNNYPNQYTGYHAAVDVEYTAADELGQAIPVRAIADGTVVYTAYVSGYGGLIIIKHDQPEPVTSLYGHVRLGDRKVNVGDQVRAGQTLAWLGAQFSEETSGARKHLHFGIHKGPDTDLAGHEPDLATLNRGWYNPNDWLRRYVPPPSPVPTLAATPTASVAPATEPVEHKNLIDKILDWLKSLFS